MLNDIFVWLVLNFALLYAAYWLWVRTHGSAHQQEQDKLIIKWAQDLEAEGKISPSEKRSFVGDLIADSLPGRPAWVSIAIRKLFDIWAAILLFRWTAFGILIIIGVAYGTIENMVTYNDKIAKNNIDDSRMLYSIWTPDCELITDADANVIKISSTQSKCTISAEQMSAVIAKHSKSSAIKTNTSKIIWTYIFVFVWFYGILNMVDPTDDPDYNSERVFDSFVVGWIVISILLFPITFREYPSSVDISVFDPSTGSESMSVSTVYLTNDGERYVFTSPTYMGRIRSSFDPTPF